MINGELIVDNFAGGGGASTGIEDATGCCVDIAINHDPEAIKMHKANHPYTEHYCEDVWQVDPVKACKGHPVGLAWFSPDCKHFSKAKGGKPKDKFIRGLAWVACRWAGLVRPRVIMLENVEEFKTWGPLNRGHHPIKNKQGKTFEKFVQQLMDLGYEVQYRELIAADYGAPACQKDDGSNCKRGEKVCAGQSGSIRHQGRIRRHKNADSDSVPLRNNERRSSRARH